MKIPQELVDYQKLIDVINSCKTQEHLNSANKYYTLWKNKYPLKCDSIEDMSSGEVFTVVKKESKHLKLKRNYIEKLFETRQGTIECSRRWKNL